MRKGILIWALVSGALMVVGGVGPWVTGYGSSVNGTNGDGWIVIGAAVVGCVLCFVLRRYRAAGSAAIATGVIAMGTAGYDRSNLEKLFKAFGAVNELKVGWGLNLALVASFSFALAGLLGVILGPKRDAVASYAPGMSSPPPPPAPAMTPPPPPPPPPAEGTQQS